MRALVDRSDVLIENLRPGTLERLGLDPADLLATNPGLVILRVTGFGQDGPYAARPGFATMAEAMGGFAAINGAPEGPPLLPPVALTDEVSALVGAFAVMVALHHRDRTGEGQVIDVSLLESMVSIMGPLPAVWAQLGELQPRLGSGIPYSVPRGDVSVRRRRVGRGVDVGGDGGQAGAWSSSVWVTTRGSPSSAAGSRTAPSSTRWWARGLRRGRRPRCCARSTRREAAIAPVYTMADLLADDHVRERGTFVEVDGVTMPGPVARSMRTPGAVRPRRPAARRRHRRGAAAKCSRSRPGESSDTEGERPEEASE